jgi:hypothetical protein
LRRRAAGQVVLAILEVLELGRTLPAQLLGHAAALAFGLGRSGGQLLLPRIELRAALDEPLPLGRNVLLLRLVLVPGQFQGPLIVVQRVLRRFDPTLPRAEIFVLPLEFFPFPAELLGQRPLDAAELLALRAEEVPHALLRQRQGAGQVLAASVACRHRWR